MREIDTKTYQSTEQANQSNSRIEIVEWDDTVSSNGQKSCSTKQEHITLSQVMMGSTGGPQASKGTEDKLTVDNLWKILASEKNINEAAGRMHQGQDKHDSRSQSRNAERADSNRYKEG